jgi:hypothetical protein
VLMVYCKKCVLRLYLVRRCELLLSDGPPISTFTADSIQKI